MAPRVELQALLETLLGSVNVYFQPPPSVSMNYPAIVYKLDGRQAKHADNVPYIHRVSYQITVMDRNPDSLIPKKVAGLSTASFKSRYTSDNLYHDVFSIIF